MIIRRFVRIKVLQILYSQFINKKNKFCNYRHLYHLFFFIEELIQKLVKKKNNKNIIKNKSIIYSNFYFFFLKKKWKKNINLIIEEFIKEEDFKNINNYNYNYNFLIKNIINIIKKSYKEKILNYIDNNINIQNVLLINNDLKWFLYLKKYNYFNEYFFLFKKILKEKKFFFNLYKKTKINEKYFDKIIKNYSNNWNLNRISIIDKIILRMSLCELFYFYEIPKKVTINEYIEISKIFSTDKSKNFINGILDKVCKIKNINKN